MKTIATATAAVLLSSQIAAAAIGAGDPGNEQVLINNPAPDLIEEFNDQQILLNPQARHTTPHWQTAHHYDYDYEEECYWDLYYDAWLGIFVEELVCYY